MRQRILSPSLQNTSVMQVIAAIEGMAHVGSCTVGWANTPLMILYQHGLKEKIQLAVVMSKIDFDSLWNPTRPPRPQPCSSSTRALTPDPHAMDLSAFQKSPRNQLSDAEQTRWVQRNLCFRFGQAGHISHGCLNGALPNSGGNQLPLRQPS
ncbi:uncharacterized protein VP01_4692g1 [Puccinia sorghi]|uniref:Uncharacterized protein n=1 Tax=Puccinia sorghi TaxID=27349 RepID=A0A0L6UN34_9BASI|nr:uncharacterized protein VP01_4692g1 [Puccinia sorghi]